MALSKNLVDGLLSLFQKRKAERELDKELGDYLDQSIAEKMHQGMAAKEARREASIDMGGVEVVKEKVRAASWEATLKLDPMDALRRE
jgi:ribosomal protein L20A (L18A)